jgi:hypothetical protein
MIIIGGNEVIDDRRRRGICVVCITIIYNRITVR